MTQISLSPDQQRLAAAFPEIVWAADAKLCIFKPGDALTPGLVARLVEWLYEIETDSAPAFNRFTDLTNLNGTHLQPIDVATIAFWRRATYNGMPVKSAFLASSPDVTELAKTYEAFMTGGPILVRVFTDRAEAAQWLEVPGEFLH